jgi:hypothetical protein
MLHKIYLLAGVVVLSLFGAGMYTGFGFGTEPREKLPEDAQLRQSGYHSYFISHGGYRGGK